MRLSAQALNRECKGPFALGPRVATRSRMGFKTLGEIKAYSAARALKLEIYRLVKAHPAAFNDLRYRGQIFEAAASVEMNIAEGFRRFSAGEFARFLRISRASLEETTGWLQDGIDRDYFTPAACEQARELAEEAGRLTTGLITSLKPFVTSRRTDPAGPRSRGPRKL
jgi:four helix bundle protein